MDNNQSGNAFIYVLIAIVLFAALSFTLTRSNDDSDKNELDIAKIVFKANEILTYTSQVTKIVQQMSISGTEFRDIDFVQRGESGYDIAPHYNKIYHIAGGGLLQKSMSSDIKNETTTPDAGWYLSRFNNIEWTPTVNQDVLLVLYQLNMSICAGLNKKITGSSAIPAISVDPESVFIDGSVNVDFMIADCTECEGRSMLCVSNSSANNWTFYSIVGVE